MWWCWGEGRCSVWVGTACGEWFLLCAALRAVLWWVRYGLCWLRGYVCGGGEGEGRVLAARGLTLNFIYSAVLYWAISKVLRRYKICEI